MLHPYHDGPLPAQTRASQAVIYVKARAARPRSVCQQLSPSPRGLRPVAASQTPRRARRRGVGVINCQKWVELRARINSLPYAIVIPTPPIPNVPKHAAPHMFLPCRGRPRARGVAGPKSSRCRAAPTFQRSVFSTDVRHPPASPTASPAGPRSSKGLGRLPLIPLMNERLAVAPAVGRASIGWSTS